MTKPFSFNPVSALMFGDNLRGTGGRWIAILRHDPLVGKTERSGGSSSSHHPSIYRRWYHVENIRAVLQ